MRTAVVGAALARMAEDLRVLPTQPEVRCFPSLFGGTEDLAGFRPDVLFLSLPDDAAEAAGALRLLRGLLPGLGIVLVGDGRHEVTLAPWSERIGARVLLQPYNVAGLAAALEHASNGSNRPSEDVFLDLVRGVADELNNPLMYLSGYLQLLKASFDPVADRDRRDQLASAVGGVQRIQATVERIRLVSQAASGASRDNRVDLAALLRGTLAAAGAAKTLPLLLEPAASDFVIAGDTALLQPALAALLQVALELCELQCKAHLWLARLQQAVRLRLSISGPGLQSWLLPRTFEPYYLNRVLRGSSHGLSLFLVQTVFLAHGGQALARRLPDGSLCLDLLLPS